LVSRIPEYANLYHFFVSILRLQNADLGHYLEDLASMKKSTSTQPLLPDLDVIATSLYKQLRAETNRDPSESIRKTVR
jgi:hypothetical protein